MRIRVLGETFTGRQVARAAFLAVVLYVDVVLATAIWGR